MFLADRLSPYINNVFDNYSVYDGATLLMASVAYTLQIYLDFSGYTDMARGISKCVGYDIEINFNYPYLSRNIADFWKRWHITLSEWIRDYLYIPLGGSRCSFACGAFNVVLAMTLCGLWHGASWNFVIWGAYHGMLIVIYRVWGQWVNIRLHPALGWAVTLLSVTVGWIFFRINDAHAILEILTKIATLSGGVTWIHPFSLFALCGVIVIHVARVLDFHGVVILQKSSLFSNVVLASLVLLTIIFYPTVFSPFIYAKF